MSDRADAGEGRVRRRTDEDGPGAVTGRAARVRRTPLRCLRRLLVLAVVVSIAHAGLGLTAEAAIVVEPKNVAVTCPPGTRFVFKNWTFGHEIFSDTWVIVAITKSGKTATSGTFRVEIEAAEVFDKMAELCEELSSGASISTVARALIAAGLQPSDVALGEFNGDGRPDLAIANQGSNSVSIALGTAGGGFGPTVHVPTGTKPAHIAAGDVNGDGKQDLVTANLGTGTAGDLSMLLGNGDGTFQTPVPISAGALPVDLVLGDWNGDGKLDLAAADSGGNAVVVRLGNGNGTFQAAVSLPVGTSFAASIVAVDLNGDGKPDLASNGAIFLGNGNGSFQTAVNFVTGTQPSIVRAGDVNRDGKPDLVTATNGANVVSVHLGNGDGTVQAARRYVVGSFPNEMALIDVDGNGTLDLVVSNANDDHISVLLGKGEGTFSAASAYPGGSAAVADWNGDGVPDLLTSNVTLLPGVGLGRFGPPVSIAGFSGSRVVAADWNGDGKMDFAVTGASGNTPGTAQIALGNGNGTFAPAPALPLPAGFSPFPFVRFPLVVDVNRDGKPDLVVANPGADNLSVFVNAGGGAFNAPIVVPVGNQPTWLAAGDVNGDGKPDLMVVNHGDFGSGNGNITVLIGDGNGGFQSGQVLRSNVEPDSVGVADLNGDGKLDVVAVVQISFDWNLNVFLGNGDGSFGGPAVVSLPQDLVTGLRVADLDLDGRADVIVSLDSTKVGLLRNRGDATFEPPVIVDAGGGNSGSLAVADVNRDGRPDVIVDTGLGLVSVLLNATSVAAPGTVAAILPVSRAVSVHSVATVFATIINATGAPFTGCEIRLIPALPGTFIYQTTDPGTNVPTGTPNTRVDIGAGDFQTFVLAFTPDAPFPPIDVDFAFACDGVVPAAPIPGVNTLTLSSSVTPGPDLIAIAATSPPGRLLVSGVGAFAVATANVGAAGTVTVSADTGGAALPLVLSWCQTNSAAVCLAPPTSAPLPISVAAGATPTFSIFAAAAGPIAFDPGLHRVFFRVRNVANHVIGATSVAVSGGP